MTIKRGGKHDPDVDAPAGATKTRFLLKTSWRMPGNLHYAGPVEDWSGTDKSAVDAARMQAWARFHRACGEVPLGSEDYTVDLMEESLRRIETEKSSYWARDGETRMVGHGPGADTDVRVPMPPMLVRDLAQTFRMKGQSLSDPCRVCGVVATVYLPDGAPFCDGHAPRNEEGQS